MLKVVVLLCAINAPETCNEHTTHAERLTPWACFRTAQVYAASLARTNPNMRVVKFGCRRATLMDQIKDKLRANEAGQSPREKLQGK